MRTMQIEHFEVFMLLDDKHRDILVRMLDQRGVSRRTLAIAAGYKSHSYMTRLLRGEARWVDKRAAVRIAAFLGVPIDVLFLAKVVPSSSTPRNGRAA